MFHYIKNNIKYIIIHLLILGFMYVILVRETIIEGGMIEDIGGAFSDGADAFVGGVTSAGEALRDAGGNITAAASASLSEIRGAANKIAYNATAAYNTVKNGASKIGGFVDGLISGLLSAVLNGLAKAVARLLSAFNRTLSSVNDVLDKATHFEQDVVNGIKKPTPHREGFGLSDIRVDARSPAEIYAEENEKLDHREDTITTMYLDGKMNEAQYQDEMAIVADIRKNLKSKYRIAPTTKYVLWENTPEGKSTLADAKAAAKVKARASAESLYARRITKIDNMIAAAHDMFQAGKLNSYQYATYVRGINDTRDHVRSSLDNFDQLFEQSYKYSG